MKKSLIGLVLLFLVSCSSGDNSNEVNVPTVPDDTSTSDRAK